jgi:hypothetical protein
MPFAIRIVLLLLALVTYAAGGAALAAVRTRAMAGRRDIGMSAVAASLIAVGALCTTAGAGPLGVLAFGAVTVWASYIVTAQRLGVFRVQTRQTEATPLEEPEPRA